MPYDETLDARISDVVTPWGATRKKMFGGTGYLLAGNLMTGVWHDSLIVRLSPEDGAAALARPNVVPFDVTGRPMRGWVMVEPAGVADGASLLEWLLAARTHAESLPPK
ncbi:MAG: TfoX/Sxy family protein [Actinobacteria bacterium]|nr:MAG: TfoX/Sxy family protein [Actinomycetota bacterium]